MRSRRARCRGETPSNRALDEIANPGAPPDITDLPPAPFGYLPDGTPLDRSRGWEPKMATSSPLVPPQYLNVPALPVARTRDEAHLYMDLHPCEHCRSVDTTWESGLVDRAGAPARRYHGLCRGCWAQRDFVFRLPERPGVPAADDLVYFGGPEPSQLFDPGEWRLIADEAIRDGSAPRTGDPAVDADRRRSFALAVAALGEILKFIPAGADAVLADSFRTAHGRTVYEGNPAHFSRVYLVRRRQNFADEMEDRFRDL